MKNWSGTRLRVALSLVAATPFLAACGDVGASESAGPRVVASFYPLGYVAERVAGEHADVEVLTSPGQEPHDLELTFRQTAEVADADLMIYLAGFQPAVDDAVSQSDAVTVEAGGPAHVVGLGGEGDEHADEEEGDAHFHPEGDPHFWLDPTRMADVAASVEEQLAEVDPDHAEDYAANLAALQDDLTALDEELAAGLADCARDTIVVSHNAFGYFADRYSIGVESINGLTPDAEPSPAHLAELADLIEDAGITTVFSETLASPALADTLASELGLETAVLDPVEGLSDATEDEDYLSLMRANLATIQEANDCS